MNTKVRTCAAALALIILIAARGFTTGADVSVAAAEAPASYRHSGNGLSVAVEVGRHADAGLVLRASVGIALSLAGGSD